MRDGHRTTTTTTTGVPEELIARTFAEARLRGGDDAAPSARLA